MVFDGFMHTVRQNVNFEFIIRSFIPSLSIAYECPRMKTLQVPAKKNVKVNTQKKRFIKSKQSFNRDLRLTYKR